MKKIIVITILLIGAILAYPQQKVTEQEAMGYYFTELLKLKQSRFQWITVPATTQFTNANLLKIKSDYEAANTGEKIEIMGFGFTFDTTGARFFTTVPVLVTYDSTAGR